MDEKSMTEILDLARTYSEKGTPWHHHFLADRCILSKSKKFQIILENEKTGESFVSRFDRRPMKELELLENLFFKRKK